MKARLLLLSGLCWIVSALPTLATERSNRPLQLQLVNFSGLSAGYHLSDRLYLGYTYVSSVDFTMEATDPTTAYGQDYVEETRIESDPDQAFELRYSPFENGFYLSVGALSTGRDYTQVVFERRNRVLPNDTQLSATQIIVETEVDPWSGVGVGLGYTAVWDFGLSLGIGFLYSPTSLEPKITVTFDPDVTEADKLSLTQRVEDDLGTINPTLGYLAIGYNF